MICPEIAALFNEQFKKKFLDVTGFVRGRIARFTVSFAQMK